jgi:hypothetical protein
VQQLQRDLDWRLTSWICVHSDLDLHVRLWRLALLLLLPI